MLVLQEGLDFYLVDKSLDQLGVGLHQGNLLHCHDEFTSIVLCSINVSKPALSQHFSKLEFLEK